jgi:hypothetical protein
MTFVLLLLCTDLPGRGMLHLRETLPRILQDGQTASELFPPDIYSSNVVLKLPAPLPIRVSTQSGLSKHPAAMADTTRSRPSQRMIWRLR